MMAVSSHNQRYLPKNVHDSLPALEKKAREVRDRLMAHYSYPHWRPHHDPLEELIITTLAQNSTDHNADIAYRRLRQRFPTWMDVMTAPVEEVIEAVRPAGLGNQKGPRIQAILRKVWEERGAFDLGFLGEMSTEEAEAWLTSIKGVGHKTASIVLLFCFGRPTFPVDTHVSRVTKRLGLAADNASTRQIRALWETLVPPEDYYPLHLNLIRHGREVCNARAPRCEKCVLRDVCDFGRAREQAGQEHKAAPD